MMNVEAWVKYKTEDSRYNYSIQFDNLKGVRTHKRIIKEMTAHGWELTSHGSGKKDVFMSIFDKIYETQEDWVSWARTVEYPIVEFNSKNNKKATKLGSYYLNKKRCKNG